VSASPVRVYLGLGSNLADRAANLWEATRRIGALPACRVVRASPLFETEPVGLADQPWFLNCALAVDTELDALELLRAVKRLEREQGRVPGVRWGPRLIDMDVLLYDDLILASEELTLPHPELWNRRFVLLPLAAVLDDGPLAMRVAERLGQLGSAPVVRPYRL
jgi:2-amino-4-hydroxy-6-hydroxymethyldihydropteridine diphosphokinase